MVVIFRELVAIFSGLNLIHIYFTQSSHLNDALIGNQINALPNPLTFDNFLYLILSPYPILSPEITLYISNIENMPFQFTRSPHPNIPNPLT